LLLEELDVGKGAATADGLHCTCSANDMRHRIVGIVPIEGNDSVVDDIASQSRVYLKTTSLNGGRSTHGIGSNDLHNVRTTFCQGASAGKCREIDCIGAIIDEHSIVVDGAGNGAGRTTVANLQGGTGVDVELGDCERC